MKISLMTGAATAALLCITPALHAAPTVATTPSASVGVEFGAPALDGLLVEVKNDKGKGGGNGKKPKQAKGNGNGKAKNANAGNGNGNGGKGNKPEKVERADKGNGNGNGKGPDKPQRADNGKGNGNKPEKSQRADNGNGNGKSGLKFKERRAYTGDERNEIVRRVLDVRAPDGRDMVAILGATTLGLLGSNVAYSEIRDDDFYTYRNCPPGLAKKDPPCVPPGLAKQGVGYDEWVSYDEDRLNDIWLDRRRSWLDTDQRGDPDLLLLQSDQIASLYNLGAAPRGQRYALIDGVPVLLDDEDYRSLLLVNQLAQVPDLGSGISVAPTAALTQAELSRLYRLPQAGPDVNYSVLNGQLVQLTDSQYETLQLIRIARAIL